MKPEDCGVRRSALLDLVELRVAVSVSVQALGVLPWDSDDELVVLRAEDAIRVLRRHLSREVSAGEVEDWANAIEGRDDVGFTRQAQEVLGRFIFDVANPTLTEPLTDAGALAWIARLERCR